MLHGQTRYGVASRFFHEIPETLMRRINRAPRVQYSGFGNSRSPNTGHRSPVTGHAIPDAASPWRVGQSVVHPTFGAGVIVSAEGRGADARVQVNFKSGGLKWLMLEYARLIAA
jgi:DNA helicase-2/ATP-dependent DNA helicase PcrA